eukprot:Nk52_evm21s2474 gene=Nk52_evmTU21s2474
MSSLLIFSLLSDIAKGLKFIHTSKFLAHGHLSPKSCFIDSTWTCKIGHFGLTEVFRHSASLHSEDELDRLLLWTPTELLESSKSFFRETFQERLANVEANCVQGQLKRIKKVSVASMSFRNTFTKALKRSLSNIAASDIYEEKTAYPMSQSGDIWSFGIIINQLLTRDEPFGHLMLEPSAIISGLAAKDPGMLTKHSKVYFENAPLSQLADSCIVYASEQRPSISSVLTTLNKANPHSGASMADNMAKLLQGYADSLEDIVAQRTAQLREKSAALEAQTEKTQSLLCELLPKSVVSKLLNGESIAPENYECVSVFFSDIVGYTNICSLSNPMEVISFLNELYTKFDQTIQNFDVYKVETIGDAYFVVSGVPERNGNTHVRELSLMALNLLADICGVKLAHMDDMQLQLRIGIHSGPCVAGVVGIRMPHYTLYGDTINTASRMESGGMALRIHISGDTASLIEKHYPQFILEKRGTIEVKGKGSMTAYWLNGEANFHRQLPSLSFQASASQHSFK